MNHRIVFGTLGVLTAFVASSLASAGSQGITVLTNANVIDGTGSPVREGMSITIDGPMITGLAAGPYAPTGEEGEVIDLGGAYVTPGFWNMHVHLTTLLPHNHQLNGASLGAKVIRAGVNAMEGLRHGFTALRSTGEEHYIDVAWQEAFDEGFMLGPRIFASGESVSPTAGHRGDVKRGAHPERRRRHQDRQRGDAAR